ncbi:MAG: mechanosensitive ion channel family protein [Erysipelotrichaceae bacterium]|nr:mechanosensitive ion channel family protein [Erysipelotrichaceae bacterium]MBO4537411.1 mechanosensitive ion channel family protein [Erysipelotrichaceae bacterium]
MDWNEFIRDYGPRLIFSLSVIIAAVILTRLVKRSAEKFEKRKGATLHIKFIGNIIRVLIWIMAAMLIGSQFSSFSNTLNTIITSSGILALGVSMAAQESLSNLIDGIFISSYKPFDIGDRITLPEKNGLTGIVSEMNLRHTIITTFNNTRYIISNSALSNTIIENSSDNDSFTSPIVVSITYGSDIDRAMKILEEIVAAHPNTVDKRTEQQKKQGVKKAAAVLFNFGESSIDLRIPVVTRSVGESYQTCCDIRYQIKKRFDAEGIGFPFPTVTIDNLGELRQEKAE